MMQQLVIAQSASAAASVEELAIASEKSTTLAYALSSLQDKDSDAQLQLSQEQQLRSDAQNTISTLRAQMVERDASVRNEASAKPKANLWYHAVAIAYTLSVCALFSCGMQCSCIFALLDGVCMMITTFSSECIVQKCSKGGDVACRCNVHTSFCSAWNYS